MKRVMIAGFASALLLTACKKDNEVAVKSLEQQKMEFQARQLEIEKQKLAIEKEKFEYDAQKKADSIAEVKASKSLAATNEPAREIIREKTVYVNNPSPNNTVATSSGNQNTTSTTQKRNE